MKAKIRGTELYFDVAGMALEPKGKELINKPVVFMLHGGPGGDHLSFKKHSIAFANHAQLVFIDHRGCGRSKKTKQKDYTLDNNIEDIEALRKYLGLEKICILGTSYGGMVAQGYAVKYSKHLEKLILVVTVPSHHLIDDGKRFVEEYGTPKQIKLCNHLWNGTFKNHKHIMEYFAAVDGFYSTRQKRSKKSVFGISHTVWSHQAANEGFKGQLRTFNFIPKLKKIKCPTLIIAGEKDWICPPKHSKIIAKEIPNSKLHILKNAGHAVAIDAPKQYLSLISRFLKL